ncbi:MAG: DUF4974 domain-containing protein [Planctomycetota bacterium]
MLVILCTGPTVWGQSAEDSSASSLADEVLSRTVSLEFLDTPLSTALERLQRDAGVNTLIDPNHASQIAKNPITLRLTDAKIADALDLMCLTANADWDVINGVVVVSIPEVIMQRRLTTEIYDIRGLLVSVQNQVAPSFDLTDALSNTSSGGGGGRQSKSGNEIAGGGSGGGGASLFVDEGQVETMATLTERIEQVVQLIEETIGDVAYWEQELFTVREIAGSLVIQTTPEFHDDIAALLGSLDRQAGRMVQIQGDYFIMPRSVVDAVLTDNEGALIVSPEHLSDVSAKLADAAASRFASTRNVGFNGQRVYVYAGRDRTFLSDIEAIPDAEGFDTTLSVLRDGVVLDVLPTLVGDGQDVVVAIKSDVIPAATQIKAAGLLPSEGGDTARVEAPERDTLFYRTTVRVPVGGAVILSGASSLLSSVDADNSEIVLLLRVDAVE